MISKIYHRLKRKDKALSIMDSDPLEFAKAFDLFVRQHGYVRASTPDMILRELNRRPQLVVDIGVRKGTPWLYTLYPNAFFLLVDPQKEGEKIVESFPKKFEFISKALGGAEAKLILNEQRAKSTFLERTELTKENILETYTVDVTTLDNLLDNYDLSGKVGVKIDTEGYEVEVIKGLERHIDKIDFIVAEVSVRNRFHNSYNFSELVSAYYEKGFRFYNYANDIYAIAPRFYDCIFLRKDDPAFN